MKRLHSRFLIALFAALLPLMWTVTTFADDTDDEIDDLNNRVDDLELRLAKDKISFYGDFRVKTDYLQYEYPSYFQYTGGDPMDPSNYMPVQPYNLQNTENWSARLRLKMYVKVSPTLHFTGRLVMNHAYGGSDVPIFNGFPNTLVFGANSTAYPGDNVIRVERAAMTWDPEETPFFFTVGRQAATNGPPRELREDRVRQATPGALMIDGEIDGAMIGAHLNSIGLPDGAIIRMCYGTGYESGFGTGGRVLSTMVNTPKGPTMISDLKDSRVLGGCFETPIPSIPGTTLLTAGYMRFIDMTDISTGYARSFPDPTNSDPQLLTATNNLGDMDLFGLCFQHSYQGFDWFASVAVDKSHPDVGAVSAYGFGGLLGNPTGSETGSAYYIGARADVKSLKGKIGLEFNHGDEHWYSFTPAADDFGMSKLATRGSVVEAYYIQRVEKKLNLRLGVQAFDYNYAFSGWHIAPGPMEMFNLDNSPSLAYPFPDKITNIYVVADMNF